MTQLNRAVRREISDNLPLAGFPYVWKKLMDQVRLACQRMVADDSSVAADPDAIAFRRDRPNPPIFCRTMPN